ncbi:MAG TPA: hypothetical protein VH601_04780 [Bryobacteraceae bacterium]
MRVLMLLFATAGFLTAAGILDVFGHHWTVPEASDWKIEQENGAQILRLVTHRGPLPGPRRPIQFALADTPPLEKATVEADMRPLGLSLIIVFAYRDAAHFDYAHLSVDTATKEAHHNGVFHVYDGERVRISPVDGPAAFSSRGQWHHVQFVWDGTTGEVQVRVNGQFVPALHAVDLSLRSGRVGLGSFDETGDFKNVKIR